jgi:RNA polymerase sigma-70 factor (ECF subfamily)
LTATASWDEIASTHWSRVYAYSYRLTGNSADAEDLAQDVFVRALRALATSQPANLGGWLHRITRNLYLDRVRHQRRLTLTALPHSFEWAADVRSQPEEIFDARGLDSDIASALDGLSADTRAAVLLCDVAGLTYAEIAVHLGVGRGAVRSRIHRGRRQLRSVLASSSRGQPRSPRQGLAELAS